MHSWTRLSNDRCRSTGARCDLGVSSILGILGIAILGGGGGGGGGGSRFGSGIVGSCANATVPQQRPIAIESMQTAAMIFIAEISAFVRARTSPTLPVRPR